MARVHRAQTWGEAVHRNGACSSQITAAAGVRRDISCKYSLLFVSNKKRLVCLPRHMQGQVTGMSLCAFATWERTGAGSPWVRPTGAK